jgi:hypothetical protein
MIDAKVFDPTAAAAVETIAAASKGNGREQLDWTHQMLLPVLCDQQQKMVGLGFWKFDLEPAVSIQFQPPTDVTVDIVLTAHEEKATHANVVNRACVKTYGKQKARACSIW